MNACDYLAAVKQVCIADLEARLSEYFGGVRWGQPLIILDLDASIAHLEELNDSTT